MSLFQYKYFLTLSYRNIFWKFYKNKKLRNISYILLDFTFIISYVFSICNGIYYNIFKLYNVKDTLANFRAASMHKRATSKIKICVHICELKLKKHIKFEKGMVRTVNLTSLEGR